MNIASPPAADTTVDFDGVAATLTVVNDTTINATAPAHATPGVVHVHVTNPAEHRRKVPPTTSSTCARLRSAGSARRRARRRAAPRS